MFIFIIVGLKSDAPVEPIRQISWFVEHALLNNSGILNSSKKRSSIWKLLLRVFWNSSPVVTEHPFWTSFFWDRLPFPGNRFLSPSSLRFLVSLLQLSRWFWLPFPLHSPSIPCKISHCYCWYLFPACCWSCYTDLCSLCTYFFIIMAFIAIINRILPIRPDTCFLMSRGYGLSLCLWTGFPFFKHPDGAFLARTGAFVENIRSMYAWMIGVFCIVERAFPCESAKLSFRNK